MAEPTIEDITRVINGYDAAKSAAEFGETITCEMQQVEDNNYNMVWTTQIIHS